MDMAVQYFSSRQRKSGQLFPAVLLLFIMRYYWKNEVKRERYFRKKKYQKKCIPDDIIITVIKIEIDLEI